MTGENEPQHGPNVTDCSMRINMRNFASNIGREMAMIAEGERLMVKW